MHATPSTTSFGSRGFGLMAIGVVYFFVTTSRVTARALFGWLGIVPMIGGCVFLLGWKHEEAERARTREVAYET